MNAYAWEFTDLTKDILANQEFLKTYFYPHHKPFSILEHSLRVASLTHRWIIKLSRYIKLDIASATRGALLHDFFLYDWHQANYFWHEFNHPKIAYLNSRRNFNINLKIKEIILSHMWPLTSHCPKIKEALLVVITDKAATIQEIWFKFCAYLITHGIV